VPDPDLVGFSPQQNPDRTSTGFSFAVIDCRVYRGASGRPQRAVLPRRADLPPVSVVISIAKVLSVMGAEAYFLLLR
jgi:hypothetical protein